MRPERPLLVETLRNNFTFRSIGLRHALRLGLTTALAVLLAFVLPRGYWVGLSVLVTLKPNFGGTTQRAVQRVVGTFLGGLVAIALASLIQNPVMLLLCLAVLAFIAFAVRPLNYGLFVIVLTPLIMVLLNLTGAGNWKLGVWRILDTLLGGGLALLGGYLLFPSWERQRLPAQILKTIQAELVYFQHVIDAYNAPAPNTHPLHAAHCQAELQNANLATAVQRLLSEPRHLRGDVEPVMSLVVYTRSFSNSVTTLTEHLREFSGQRQLPGMKAFADAIANVLENLVDALQERISPQPLPTLDTFLEPIHVHIQQLHAARLAERAIAPNRITSTLKAIREHTLVSTELDRIANAVTAMHSAIARFQPDYSRADVPSTKTGN